MIVELLKNVLGYVRFSIRGDFPERLLNQLALSGVSVWGIERHGSEISACILKKNYLKIRQYRMKNKVYTKVLSRHGLPFKAYRYRFRVGFAAGLLIYFAALVFLSSFVWNIRVVGIEKLTEAEVLTACSKLGLYEGRLKKEIDAENLRTRLALELPEISWASVNLEGVRATVNISEISALKNPPIEDCNLIAERDGIITKFEVTSGTITVKLGQTVKKGDLLVSGITEYKDGTYKFGPSQGEVIAETVHEMRVFVPFTQQKTVRIGKPLKKRVISVFGVSVPLYLGSVEGPFETESIETRYENSEMYLPLKLTETVFYKTAVEEFTVTSAEAETIALAELESREAEDFKNAEILSRGIEVVPSEDGITLKVFYKLRENIAKKDLLLILD